MSATEAQQQAGFSHIDYEILSNEIPHESYLMSWSLRLMLSLAMLACQVCKNAEYGLGTILSAS